MSQRKKSIAKQAPPRELNVFDPRRPKSAHLASLESGLRWSMFGSEDTLPRL